MSNTFSWEVFHQIPIVGIMRNLPQAQTEKVAELFYQAGLTNLEVTMNSANVQEVIASLVDTYGSQLNIGAGTVCNMQDLEKALHAGATFIVMPIINEQVIRTCVDEQIPVFPGAYTPSEIYKAHTLGASMVKVFPATTLGVAYIKEVLAPLNTMKLLPTGGVTLDNFTDYLKAGAKGVGMGSSLFPKEMIAKNQWQALQQHFSKVITQYKENRY